MSSNESTPSSSRSPSPCYSACSSTTTMATLLADIGDEQNVADWNAMPTLGPSTDNPDEQELDVFLPRYRVSPVSPVLHVMLYAMTVVLLLSGIILASMSFTLKLWLGAGLGAELVLCEVIFAFLDWKNDDRRRGRRSRDIAFFPSF